METQTEIRASDSEAPEPVTRKGLEGAAHDYMTQGAKPAEPSVISTNSRYLNNPFFRDAYAQLGLRRNGPDLPSTYIIPMLGKALGEVIDFAEVAGLIREERVKNREFAQWLDDRRFTAYGQVSMRGYEPGTLGDTIQIFLDESGLEMDKMMMADAVITNDIDYISQRRANIHDLEHMVTGFGPNSAGEMALVWCNITAAFKYFSPKLAQNITAGITVLATTGMQARSLHYCDAFSTALEAVHAGIAMGMALKRPLLMEPWEDMFSWQIDDIRKHLNITPGPGAQWDWTTEANRG